MTKINDEFLRHLESEIGNKFVYIDPERLEAYNFDGTEFRYQPEVVVEPVDTQQVSALMKLATAYQVPVFPRGAGTGVTGGALPVLGGVSLSFLRMNRILAVDDVDLIAIAEPGVINFDLHEAVKKKGLYYPPDPASYETSSIGGNIAEDAGGPHCFKYGTTRDYVLGLEIVLPDGAIMNTGVRTRKGVVGYDLTNLIIGSEGTLALVTRAILRLIPLPAKTVTLLSFYSTIQAMAGTLFRMTQNRIIPAALEFLDPASVNLIRDHIPFKIPHQAETLLIIDLDGEGHELDAQLETVGQLCLDQGAGDVLIAESSLKRQGLWDVRRKLRDIIKENSNFKRAEDVAVPIRAIPELVQQSQKIAGKYGLKNYNFGHLGDGNVHVNLTHHEKNQAIIEQAAQAAREVCEAAVNLGGTISGEHGIGITKKDFLEIELAPQSIQLQKQIKQLFDPLNILNPGKIFF